VPLILLDDRQLERVKTIDAETGEIVGATYEGERFVAEE